jgi:hypothetical protein
MVLSARCLIKEGLAMLPRTHRGRIRKPVLILILVALALLGATPTLAKDRKGNPGILPPQSKPHGHTYAEWVAMWWAVCFSF